MDLGASHEGLSPIWGGGGTPGSLGVKSKNFCFSCHIINSAVKSDVMARNLNEQMIFPMSEAVVRGGLGGGGGGGLR